jgi:hypothetical protein
LLTYAQKNGAFFMHECRRNKRYVIITIMLRRVSEALVDSSSYVSRTHCRLSVTIVLLVPLPSKRFGAYYSSRRNASGAIYFVHLICLS